MAARRDAVIGRSEQIEAIEAFLADVPAGASALFLRGPAGIGKTTLWRLAAPIADELGFHVLQFRAAEGECHLGLSALSELVAPVLDGVLPQLPVNQAHALEVATLRIQAEDLHLEPRLVSAGFTSVLRVLAASRPVVIAIDDLHWLDPPSAAALQYALRRVGGSPVALVAAVRTDDGDPLLSGLERTLTSERVHRVDVGPLSLAALHRLLHSRFKVTFTRPTLAQIERSSGGNPFYAIEVARAMLHRGKGKGGAAVERPPPVPAELRSLLRERIASLSDQERYLLMAVRALSRPTEASVVAAVGDGPGAAAGLTACLRAGLIEIEDDGLIRPSHPLIGSIVHAEATEDDRRRLHGRIAATVSDPEEAARHRALSATGPDEPTAAMLDEAARLARARGAASAAAELGGLALRLTPPPDGSAVLRRKLALALDEYRSGDSTHAGARWKEIVDAPGTPDVERARALWLLAELHASLQIGEVIGSLERALSYAADHPDMQARVHAGLAEMLLYAGRAEEAERHATAALSLLDASSDGATRILVLALTALAVFARGGGIPTELQAALEAEGALDELPVEILPSTYRAWLLMWSRDDLSSARAAFLEARQRAEARGDEVTLPVLDIQLCELETWLGHWDLAAKYADEAAEAVDLAGTPHLRGYSLWAQGLVRAVRGDTANARELASEALALDEPRGVFAHSGRARALLGFVELSDGRPEEAVGWLLPLHTDVCDGGHVDPFFFIFVPDLVESLVGTGRVDEALEIAASFRDRATRLRRRWAMSAAARCFGLIEAATSGRLDSALDEARAAVRQMDGLDLPFELARTKLVLGSVERRSKHKRQAVESLTEALRSFEQLGAISWAERASAELARVTGAIGGRWELSTAEGRVAQLAVTGRTNREIAAALFVSEKTVEWNLAKIYRKLGVRSRTELAARLADRTRS